MTIKHRSIGERMERAKSLATRREVAQDWALNWQDESDQLIRDIAHHIGQHRFEQAGQCLGQLKSMQGKRFGAMPRVIAALADEDMT